MDLASNQGIIQVGWTWRTDLQILVSSPEIGRKKRKQQAVCNI